MIEANHLAVYQLKGVPENRHIRFRPYETLQEKGIRVRYESYEQVYTGLMQPEDTPESIRERFDRKLPQTFTGHSISVSDVLALNVKGTVTSYYVEKEGFTVIDNFICNASSGTAVSIETTGFHIQGKKGTWLAFDSIRINEKEFFLMEHENYGKEAAWVVVDEAGRLAADNVYHGFDKKVRQQLENWQKYMENGEYLRSAELSEEQNYNMIDGRGNNKVLKKETGRPSVLKKLHQKQAEIAKRSGRKEQQMIPEDHREREQN